MCLIQMLNPEGMKGTWISTATQKKFFDYIKIVHEMCPAGLIQRKCHEIGMIGIKAEQALMDACVN